MKQATIQLETLTCPSCIQKINNAVKSLEGVDLESVNIMFNASRVKLNYDNNKLSLNDISNSITKLGYDVLKTKEKDL